MYVYIVSICGMVCLICRCTADMHIEICHYIGWLRFRILVIKGQPNSGNLGCSPWVATHGVLKHNIQGL